MTILHINPSPAGPGVSSRPGRAVFCLMLCLIFCLGTTKAFATEPFTIAKPFGPSGTDLDPAKGSNGWYASEAGITETLFALDFNMNLIPWLARGFNNLSPVSWEIRLRDNVFFHNGLPMTPQAVKICLERLINENSDGFNKRIQGLLDIKTITIKNPQTLIIETLHPNAGFIYNLSSPETGIIDLSGNTLAGTGPFQLKKVVPNEKTVVTAFHRYWNGTPKLAQAELYVIKSPVSRMLAFESGKIDIATNFPELDALRLMKQDNGVKTRIKHRPTARLCFFFVRVKDGPLADPNLRKALNYAIDRNRILASVLGGIGAEIGASVFPKVMPWCNTALSAYAYSPEKAAALLDAAGAKDLDGDGIREINGKPLHLEMWTYENRAALKPTLELIKSQLLMVGIDTGIRVTKKGSPINQAMKQGRVHLNLQMWNTAPQGDPDAFLSDVFMTHARSNVMGYANPKLDQLLQAAKTCFDQKERTRLYNQAQQIIHDENPVIVLFHKSMVTAISGKVKGYRIHPAEKYLLTPNIGKE
ncbi:ABC transporter substrate-binding protein [Desulfobacter curvatus]|uniref:ABC transporter substrate-binding protein n=1 Tax=Desulfobacter curvatus TaxID=2290 RepID=UPI000360E983|nr:ABC transporter substrate-binding protein [Desulfobacter curvatus]